VPDRDRSRVERGHMSVRPKIGRRHGGGAVAPVALTTQGDPPVPLTGAPSLPYKKATPL
jgi:hypothetical protein